MGELIATRQAFGQELVELGRTRDFVVMDADIAKSCSTDLFHAAYPERSYNFGIAEQNLMGIAAGFATTGTQVFAATYGVFASMRSCEQLRTFVAYPQLNVRVIASHGGLQVGADGATHQATEDIAIMRAIAGMTIIQPSDATTAKLAARAVLDWEGPVYIRLLRNPSPILFDNSYRFEIGKSVTHRQGGDVTLIATGAMVIKSFEAADALKAEGIDARVVEMHTIKPLDREAVVDAARTTGAIVTVEDHTIIGGLGGAVAEVLGEEAPCPLHRIGIRDVFGESGDSETLYDHYGMSVRDIVAAAKQVMQRKS